MDWQEQKERLDKLFRDPQANASEIIRIHQKIIKNTNYSVSDEVIEFLNQNDVQLLESEVVDMLKKNRLDAYIYLLVANDLLNTEDVKDDLLNGDVLANAAPAKTIRKLKADLGLSSTINPSIQLNINAPMTTAPFQVHGTQHHQNGAGGSPDINRLPIQIRNQCIETKRIDGMDLHKLPLSVASTFSGASSIIKRFSFGESDDQSTGRTSKTILLMGATGTGKTTMINAMINYILGVEWDDDFRFILVEEKIEGGSQAHSQTQGVTAYDIHYQKGFRIPFSLTIVDTPGFGDTGGIGRDKEITSAVQKFFEHQNGIQELDAVGFVVQSALVRLTDSQKYIFNSVLSIFGKDIGENVRFLVTFADGSSPPVLEAIKEAKLPCLMDSKGLPCHQGFNNYVIYKTQQSANSKRLQFDWDDGMENFKSFFQELNDMPTKSLQMTKEVLEMRKCLEIQLDFMQRGINEQLMKMEELRKTEEIIALNREHVDANKNFEVKVPVSKKVRVMAEDKSALNCTKCEVTCHHPCNPRLWTGFCPAFWRSENIVPGAMNVLESVTKLKSQPIRVISDVAETVLNTATNLFQSNRTCKVCPDKCPSGDHTNEDTKWAYTQEEETRTLYDVRKKYEDAMGQQLNAEGILNGLKEEVEQLKFDIFKTMEEITRCSNVLKKKALRGDPLTTPEYIQMMIENEKKDKKTGFNERIKSLEDVLQRAQLTRDIVDGGELTRQYGATH